eukprot:Tbor_TRINITY_DN5197_c0_g1::TRINITY_DN5197_c0_g1_i3::g.26120::m.26120
MIHHPDLNCAFCIFLMQEGDTNASIEAMRSQLKNNNYPEPIIFIRPYSELYDEAAVVNALTKFDGSCLFIDDTIRATDSLLKGLTDNKYSEILKNYFSVLVTSWFIFISAAARTKKSQTRKDMLFLKPSRNVEQQHLVEVMIHHPHLNCAFCIFLMQEGDTNASIEAMRSQLKNNNYPEPIIFIRPFGEPYDEAAVVNALTKFDGSCLFIDDTIRATDSLLKGLTDNKYSEILKNYFSVLVTSWFIFISAAARTKKSQTRKDMLFLK